MKKGFNSLIRFTGVSLLTALLGISLQAQTPTAVADDLPAVAVNVDVSFDPLVNDIINDPSKVEVKIIMQPTNGTANIINGTNSIIYSSDANFEGVNTFEYEVCDTTGGATNLCDTAGVTVSLGKFPVFPIASVDSLFIGQNLAGVANPEKEFNVLANDSAATTFNNMLIEIVTPPTQGIAVVDLTDNSLNYTPNLGVSGFDVVSYAYCDTFSFQQPNPNHPDGYYCDTVNAVIYIDQLHGPGNELIENDTIFIGTTPTFNSTGLYKTVNYLENNIDPDNSVLSAGGTFAGSSGGTLSFGLTIADSTFLYEPDATLSSTGMQTYTDTLTYLVCDTVKGNVVNRPGQCVTDTMLIVVVPEDADNFPVINGPTTIHTETFIGQDGTVTIDATEPEGEDLVIALPIALTFVDLPDVPTATNVLTFTYRPVGVSETSIDTFMVRVCEADDFTHCATATIIATIKDTAQAPIATDDLEIINEGASVSINIFKNDTLNGSTLKSIETPTLGTLTIDSTDKEDVIITYIGNGNTFGTETLKYVVCRDSCDSANVVIKIEPIFLPVVIEGVSPNGDNVNDQFTIQDVDYSLLTVSVKIFNRWGNIVFEEDNYNHNDPDKSWRGQSELGGSVVDGTYFYVVEIPSLDFKKSGDLLYISNK